MTANTAPVTSVTRWPASLAFALLTPFAVFIEALSNLMPFARFLFITITRLSNLIFGGLVIPHPHGELRINLRDRSGCHLHLVAQDLVANDLGKRVHADEVRDGHDEDERIGKSDNGIDRDGGPDDGEGNPHDLEASTVENANGTTITMRTYENHGATVEKAFAVITMPSDSPLL